VPLSVGELWVPVYCLTHKCSVAFGETYLHTKWYPDPSYRLATIQVSQGPKSGGGSVAMPLSLSGGGKLVPSNAMSPGPRQTVDHKRFALCYRTVVCRSVTLVYRGKTAGWIKMPLDTEVGLGSSHIVLDGFSSPTERSTAATLHFRSLRMQVSLLPYKPRPICLLWPKRQNGSGYHLLRR